VATIVHVQSVNWMFSMENLVQLVSPRFGMNKIMYLHLDLRVLCALPFQFTPPRVDK